MEQVRLLTLLLAGTGLSTMLLCAVKGLSKSAGKGAAAEEGAGTAESLCKNTEDATKWKAKGYGNFLVDMDECGKKCMGRVKCATQCIQSRNGYSSECATCFGTMISCTASACWRPCMN